MISKQNARCPSGAPVLPPRRNAAARQKTAASRPVRTTATHRPCAWRRSSNSESNAGRASGSSAASGGDRGALCIPRGCVRQPSRYLYTWIRQTSLTSTDQICFWARIQLPQHARPLFFVLEHRRPFPAEAHFIEPVARRDRGDQNGERQNRQGPRLL